MLTIAVADRLEVHVSRLVAALTEPLDDPFVPDWVAVPSSGMQRWLAHRLAQVLGATGPTRRDGVATNIDFTRPGKLRDLILAADRDPDWVDPWKIAPLTWTLHLLLATRGDELGVPSPASGATIHSVARRIADHFDRYHLHRPDMIRSWAEGSDVDGVGEPLAPDKSWQPRLWRAASAHLATPSAPQRLPGLLERVGAGDLPLDLPSRLSFFGLTVLPGGSDFIDLVNAVATTRDVNVLLLDPSPAASTKVRATITDSPGTDRRVRAGDITSKEVAHPLVRSWGRPARETAVLLADAAARHLTGVQSIDVDHDSVTSETITPAEGAASHTFLRRLQADLRADRVPTPGPSLSTTDRSVQVHSCFGATRQVEVLRDALLHLLAEDATLREEDIVVLCPRIGEFASLISGVFGDGSVRHGPVGELAGDASDLPRLRVRVADRSSAAPSPMVAAVVAILELASSDFDAIEVLEFLAHRPVRDRLDLSDRDVELVTEWIVDTNIHLGLDATRRARHDIPATLTANTWRAGVDRLLLGVAVAGDGSTFSVDELLPVDVEGDHADVLGRVADLLARLARLSDEVTTSRTVPEWIDLLRVTLGAMLEVADVDRNAFDAVLSTLADVGEQAVAIDGVSELRVGYPEIRRAVSEALNGRRGRPRFFEGGVTFTSLTPLRWVPFRVVAVLGLDESAMGSTGADGDDLVSAAALVGDSDRRSEARAALLEAALAAGDHFVIVRDGHDVTSNAEVPDAVVMAELREVLRAMVPADEHESFHERLNVDHPRQSSDDRCFSTDALIKDGGPWGFDPDAFAGSQARQHRERTRPPLFDTALERDIGPILELADLADFLANPTKHFLQHVLDIRLPRDVPTPTVHLPVELDGLEKWAVRTRLMNQFVAGGSDTDTFDERLARAMQLERAGGSLPIGSLGKAALADIAAAADVVAAEVASYGLGATAMPGPPIEIDLVLHDGTRLRGRVADVARVGTTGLSRGPVRYDASKLKAKDHLIAWLDLVALAAHDPEVPWHSVVVKAKTSKTKGTPYKPHVVDLTMRETDAVDRRSAALEALDIIVDLYRRGQREPLPLFGELSQKLESAFRADAANESPKWPGTNDWRGFRGQGGAADDDNAAFVYAGVSFDDIRTRPVRDDDPPGEGNTRLLRYATVLWGAYGDTITNSLQPSTGDPT